MTEKAKKDDGGKPDLSLIPRAALEAEARGFQFGAAKYGRDNYKQGLEASRLVAAALRHIYAWMEGEEAADDSGVSHLGHARCSLAMLLESQRLGVLKDDRFSRPSSAAETPGSGPICRSTFPTSFACCGNVSTNEICNAKITNGKGFSWMTEEEDPAGYSGWVFCSPTCAESKRGNASANPKGR